MAINIPALPVTRNQLNKLFTVGLFFNSILAVATLVGVFLSSWWIFLLLGTIGFPLVLAVFFAYKFTKFHDPMKHYAINFVRKLYEKIVTQREGFMKRVYTTACWFIPTEEWHHINWGYASFKNHGETMQIDPTLEDKRFYCQLYIYLATGMGNWNTLDEKTILELRSGGGGGLNFIAETLKPKKCIGIETSSKDVEFCQKSFSDKPQMSFYKADSLDKFNEIKEFGDEKVDLVISLQSSKEIKDFERFLMEVDSVLKPGKIFAFTDLRRTEDWASLEKQMEDSSLKILKKENITNHVVQAVKLDDTLKWQWIYRRIGSMVRKMLKGVGLIKDNPLIEPLTKGTESVMTYLLQKSPHIHVVG